MDRDMFMRYHGGGVGHLYMRAIEAWLAETGWGSPNIPTPSGGDPDPEEESSKGVDDRKGTARRNDRNSEDEVSGDEESDEEHHSDPNNERASDNEGEETAEGEYGYGRY